MAAKYNFSVDQGTDFTLRFTLKDENDLPINLTGYTFAAQARSKFLDTSPAFSFVFDVKDQVTMPGQLDMSVPRAATSSLVIRNDTPYFYDFEVTVSSKTYRYLEGVVTVRPEATK